MSSICSMQMDNKTKKWCSLLMKRGQQSILSITPQLNGWRCDLRVKAFWTSNRALLPIMTNEFCLFVFTISGTDRKKNREKGHASVDRLDLITYYCVRSVRVCVCICFTNVRVLLSMCVGWTNPQTKTCYTLSFYKVLLDSPELSGRSVNKQPRPENMD